MRRLVRNAQAPLGYIPVSRSAPQLPLRLRAGPAPQVQGEDDWMAKYFFSGGTMPSPELMLMFQDDLAVQRTWWVEGGAAYLAG